MTPDDLGPVRAAVLSTWAELAPHLDVDACLELRRRLIHDPEESIGNLRELRQNALDAAVARLCELDPAAAPYYRATSGATPEVPDDPAELLPGGSDPGLVGRLERAARVQRLLEELDDPDRHDDAVWGWGRDEPGQPYDPDEPDEPDDGLV